MPPPILSLELPALLVNLSMVTPAEQREVVQLGRTSVGPELQVMGLTPRWRPIAAGEHAAVISSDKCSSRRGRRCSAGMGGFVVQFAKPRYPCDRRVAGEASDCRHWDQPAALELARLRAIDARKRVHTRRDNQQRPGRKRIGPARPDALARLDQGVVRSLTRRPVVVL